MIRATRSRGVAAAGARAKLTLRSAVIQLSLACLIACLGPSGATAGDDATALFNQAGDLYEQGNFESARRALETIRERGIRNAEVYYNLGNCYYREGHTGKAVANYRRALMLSPRDGDIRANLSLIRSSVGSGDTTATYRVAGMTAFPLRVLSPRQLQMVFYIAYYLAAACFLAVLFLKGRLRRAGSYGLAAAVAVACCAFWLSRYSISTFKSPSEAVVVTDHAEFKSGPGNAFEEMTTLSDGLELRRRARSGMWVEVQLPTGEIGWVRDQDIEGI